MSKLWYHAPLERQLAYSVPQSWSLVLRFPSLSFGVRHSGEQMSNLFWNLLAMAIGGLCTWAWTRFLVNRRRERRIRALSSVRSTAEIAVCIRVGGASDPLPDVRAFLRVELPEIKKIYAYDAGGELDLANPATALQIVDDICEGLQVLGGQQVTRVHLFNSGVLAYVPASVSVIANWCAVTIYYKTGDGYIALYDFEKGHRYQKRLTKPAASWKVLDARLST